MGWRMTNETDDNAVMDCIEYFSEEALSWDPVAASLIDHLYRLHQLRDERLYGDIVAIIWEGTGIPTYVPTASALGTRLKAMQTF
jgi:hypothetical protein